MIIAEIGRGLGNSMFVYAATKSLAEHHKTELKLDITHIQSWPKLEKYGGDWDFTLGKFNISAPIATKKELRKYVFKTKFRPIDKLFRKHKLFEKNVRTFPTNGDIKDFFKIPNNSYLYVYCGHQKFFDSIKKIIQKEFTLKDEYKKKINPLLNDIKKQNSISIHVRRGDVLKIKDCNILDVDYYKKAIKIIKKKTKHPIFYVFSDDISWCKQNFNNLNIKLKFIEGNTAYEDLELMKSCKHNILANSAMSWWAGYLNTNPQKTVIAPKQFTHFKNDKTEKNLPEDWTLI